MGDLYAHFYQDYTERNLLLATSQLKDVDFATQLPGGFAEASLVLPAMFYSAEQWKEQLLGKHMVLTDGAGARVYEGSVDGAEDTDAGINVQMSGYYSKLGLQTTYLTYPNPPTDLRQVVRELCDLVPQLISQLFVGIGDDFVSTKALEFMYEVKVQEAVEKLLKENVSGGKQVQFAIYDHLRPFLFYALTPWWRVSRWDLSLKFGSSLSLSNVFNKIQVIYEVNGEKRFTPWYENKLSQGRYGIREGSVSVGDVPLGVAQVAGELAINRYSKPDEAEHMTVNGVIRHYKTGTPADAMWLRAGQLLFVTDLPANPDSRYVFEMDRVQRGYLIKRTQYNHADGKLTVEVGDALKTYDQYMLDMGVSGGNVK